MTVAVRVIPCLDVDAGRVVKGVNFENLRDAGDPVELAAALRRRGRRRARPSSTSRRRRRAAATMLDVVRRTAEQVFIPLTVGGGVRTVDDVDTAAARRRGQGRRQHRRDRPPGADRRDRRPVRVAVHRALGRRATVPAGTRRRRRAGRSPRTAAGAAPASTRSSGRARRRTRRRGDPAQLDGRRRHQGRLRPGDDRAPCARSARPGDRQRRRGRGRSTSRPRSRAGADAVLAASVFHFGELTIGEVKDAMRAAESWRAMTAAWRRRVRSTQMTRTSIATPPQARRDGPGLAVVQQARHRRGAHGRLDGRRGAAPHPDRPGRVTYWSRSRASTGSRATPPGTPSTCTRWGWTATATPCWCASTRSARRATPATTPASTRDDLGAVVGGPAPGEGGSWRPLPDLPGARPGRARDVPGARPGPAGHPGGAPPHGGRRDARRGLPQAWPPTGRAPSSSSPPSTAGSGRAGRSWGPHRSRRSSPPTAPPTGRAVPPHGPVTSRWGSRRTVTCWRRRGRRSASRASARRRTTARHCRPPRPTRA